MAVNSQKTHVWAANLISGLLEHGRAWNQQWVLIADSTKLLSASIFPWRSNCLMTRHILLLPKHKCFVLLYMLRACNAH
jgi:hypothetical protein